MRKTERLSNKPRRVDYSKLNVIMAQRGATHLTSFLSYQNKIISPNMQVRINNGQMISGSAIYDICEFLHVQPGAIMEFIYDDESDAEKAAKEEEVVVSNERAELVSAWKEKEIVAKEKTIPAVSKRVSKKETAKTKEEKNVKAESDALVSKKTTRKKDSYDIEGQLRFFDDNFKVDRSVVANDDVKEGQD